jgi:uncharacterized membrane protein YfcA
MLTETFALLVLAAFVAGFVDSIAGGGGLITIPTLLLSGLDPLTALGTNKLQALFGSGSASISYAAKGHVDLRALAPTALLSFAGALVGGLAAMVLPTDVLETLLPFLLCSRASSCRSSAAMTACSVPAPAPSSCSPS